MLTAPRPCRSLIASRSLFMILGLAALFPAPVSGSPVPSGRPPAPYAGDQASSKLSFLQQVEGVPEDVMVQGDRLYVGGARLQVYDLRDDPPRLLGASAPGTVMLRHLEPAGDFVFASNGSRTVLALDVRDPAAPVLASSLLLDTSTGLVQGLAHASGRLYAATSKGLSVLDARDPAHLVYGSAVPLPEDATWSVTGLQPRGDRLFAIGNPTLVHWVLFVLSLDDPDRPVLLSQTVISEPSAGTFGPRAALALAGDILYAADLTSLIAVDVRDATKPVKQYQLPLDTESPIPLSHALEMAVDEDGRRLFIVRSNGLYVMDLSPAVPTLLTKLDPPPPFLTLSTEISGPHGAIAWRPEGSFLVWGFEVFRLELTVDARLVTTPLLRGSRVRAVRWSGDRLVVGDDDGISLYQRGQDDLLLARGSLTGPAPAAIDTRGDTVYVASAAVGLQVLDIADADHPRELGRIGGICPYAQTVFENLVLLAGNLRSADGSTCRGDPALVLVDVSDPAAPRWRGFHAMAVGGAFGVVAAHGRAFVATSRPSITPESPNGQLVSIDIHDPEHPTELSALSVPGVPDHLDLYQDLVVAGINAGALGIFRPGADGALSQVASIATPNQTLAVRVAGRFAYVSNFNAGLTLVDLGDPTAPRLVETVNTPGFTWQADVSRGLVALADYEGGLFVYRAAADDRAPVRLVLPALFTGS